MEEFILFVMSFLTVLIIYEVIISIKIKKKQDLLEVRYLTSVYNLDLKKINKKRLMHICAIVSSLDISIAVSLISLLNGLVEVIIGTIVIVAVLIYFSYYLVYFIYAKKGMIKDGKHKKNRK